MVGANSSPMNTRPALMDEDVFSCLMCESGGSMSKCNSANNLDLAKGGTDGQQENVRWSDILGRDSIICLLYTSPSPRDLSTSRMPSSA